MNLTNNERRIFTDYENRRELAEVGQDCDAVCGECFEDVSGEDDAFTVLGEAFCPDCAMGRALELRSDDLAFCELSTKDRLEVLEVLETQAHAERATLLRRLKGGR